MNSNEFSRICKEIAPFSETVTIETNKNYVRFYVTGENISGSVRIESFESDNKEDSITILVDEPVNLAFALRYLNLFTKAGSLTEQITLNLSNECPLMVEYKVKCFGALRFYLAPRISEANFN